jgi:hypothetical protein
VFTDEERARLRVLLGWSSLYHETDDRLENAMDAFSTVPTDLARIRTLLTELDTIDALIVQSRDTAGVTKAGSIELMSDSGQGFHKSEGRRLVNAIAALIGCEVKRNYYSAGAPKGGEIHYG